MKIGTTFMMVGFVVVGGFVSVLGAGCVSETVPTDGSLSGRVRATQDHAPSEFTLKVQGLGGNTTSGCITANLMGWAVVDVSFQGGDGSPDRGDCILSAAYIAEEDTIYFVSGDPFDIRLDTPAYDNDVVRHAVTTAEDEVVVGRFPIAVGARDLLCPLAKDEVCSGPASAPIYTGTLEVLDIDKSAGTIGVRL